MLEYSAAIARRPLCAKPVYNRHRAESVAQRTPIISGTISGTSRKSHVENPTYGTKACRGNWSPPPPRACPLDADALSKPFEGRSQLGHALIARTRSTGFLGCLGPRQGIANCRSEGTEVFHLHSCGADGQHAVCSAGTLPTGNTPPPGFHGDQLMGRE